MRSNMNPFLLLLSLEMQVALFVIELKYVHVCLITCVYVKFHQHGIWMLGFKVLNCWPHNVMQPQYYCCGSAHTRIVLKLWCVFKSSKNLHRNATTICNGRNRPYQVAIHFTVLTKKFLSLSFFKIIQLERTLKGLEIF